MDDCARKYHHQSILPWRSKKPRSHGRRRNHRPKRKREPSLSKPRDGYGQHKRSNRQTLALSRLLNGKEEFAPQTDFWALPGVSPDYSMESAELPPALDRYSESDPSPPERTFTDEDVEEFFTSCVECSESTKYSDQTEVQIGVGEFIHREPPCCLSD